MKRSAKADSAATRSCQPTVWTRLLLWLQPRKPLLFFLLKFGGLIVLLYTLLAIPFCDQLLYLYLKANAWMASGILDLLGQGTRDADVTISSPHFAIGVRRGCDAVEPTWLLAAAVLCLPGSALKKLLGILAGIVVLQALNLVRLVSLFWIGIHYPSIFDTAHMEIWPMLFILAAILLFLGYINWSGRTKADVPA